MRVADRPLAQDILTGLLEVSKTDTIRSFYERLEPAPDGRIRSSVNPAGTETGRFSHSATFLEPSTNLGNMPKKVAGLHPLYNVRTVLVPSPGCTLLEGDFSQAEARDAAFRSGDPLAIAQYEEGIDRYRFFAAKLYGVPESKVTKEQRHVGKTVVLAMQYGVSPPTLFKHVNKDADLTGATITAAEAKEAVRLFHELYPWYARWWGEVFETACAQGYLENAFGRRRTFWGRDDTPAAVAALKREMVAFLPQSDIADLLNWRLGILYEMYDPKPLRILMQIHDAILCEAYDEDVEEAEEALQRTLDVHLTIDGKRCYVPGEVSKSKESWAKAA